MMLFTRRNLGRSLAWTAAVTGFATATTLAAHWSMGNVVSGTSIALPIILPLVLAFPALVYVFAVKEQLRRTVADLSEANRLLSVRATFDALTGMLMREAFFEAIDDARKECNPGILLMIDADHFKPINDRHGHLSGDIVLVAIAQAIRSSLRTGDIVGRLGGEEFAAYLKATDGEAAWSVAQRIRHCVEQLDLWSLDDAEMHVTVSIGIAKWTRDRSRSQLLAAADRQLYRAKEAGRNRVMAE